jgi:uncharacterized membrane protein YbhN (UPF0104 family)
MNFKKTAKFLFQLVFSAAVLGWLVHKLGGRDLLQTFSRMSLAVLGLGLIAYLAAQSLSAWRWAIIAKVFGFKARLVHYNALYYLGMFYNLFLPTGYGGDVVKAVCQAPDRAPPSKTFAALSILLDRFTGFATVLAIGGIASWGLKAQLGIYGAVMSWGFLLSMIAAIGGVAAVSRLKFLPRKLRFIGLALRAKGLQLIPAALFSIVIQFLNIFIYWAIFQSLGVRVTLTEICFAYAIVTTATLLPVSIGGLGVRESGWAALMIPFGAAPSAGMSAGLIYFLIQSLASLPGLIPFFSLKIKNDERAKTLAS